MVKPRAVESYTENSKWPLVLVRWLDSSTPRGWHSLAEWPGIGSHECVSVGFLYAEDETSKTVIPHFAFPNDDMNRQGNRIMVISAGAVLSVERLVSSGCSGKASLPARSSASAQGLSRDWGDRATIRSIHVESEGPVRWIAR
jgi:hypothetical protein